MTLDEAIRHSEEVAKEQDKLCKRYDDASGYTRSGNEKIRTNEAKKCAVCAEEHRMLAWWLRDYKRLKTELFENGYDHGYEDGKKASCDCNDNLECEYIRGLNEAWEVIQNIVDVIGGYSDKMLMDIFGTYRTNEIVQRYAPQDAIRMIKEYKEQQQQQDTEIRVGDEVVMKYGYKGIVITDVPEGGIISVWFPNCTHVQMYPIENLTKTGRHFDQIAEVLKEMRSESE